MADRDELPPNPQTYTGPERRASARHASGGRPVCRLASPNAEPRWARLGDVSAGGIGFRLNGPLEPGSSLTVEILGPGGITRASLAAQVVHCREAGEGTWHVGCRFESPLAEDQLVGLLWPGTSPLFEQMAKVSRQLHPRGGRWFRRHPTLVEVLFLVGVGAILVGLGLPPLHSLDVVEGGNPTLLFLGAGTWALAAVAGFVYWWRRRW